MPDFEPIFGDLASIGLASWREDLGDLLAKRFSPSTHGDLDRWKAILARLPDVERPRAELHSKAITIPVIKGLSRNELRAALLGLGPWRKGPFDVCGVYVDSEWRSDMKWDRIVGAMTSLQDRSVLDVGCGNGYYALRMRGAGAKLVIGLDPTLLYVMQFHAIRHFMQPEPVHLLPLRLQELPAGRATFDTVVSMGVLSHQRQPEAHLRDLRATLRRGGELVLETLILPGNEAVAHTPDNRYARMRNIWLLPTVAQLESWLESAGFENQRLIDVTLTTVDEQRTTEWMPFESLEQALDPTNSDLTIEGWPAPRRALFICNRP